jgi:hypothetical protein
MQVTLSMLDRNFAQFSNEQSTHDAIEAKLRYAVCNNRKKGRKSRLSSGIELSPKGKGGKPTGKHRRVHDYLQGIIAGLNRDRQGNGQGDYDGEQSPDDGVGGVEEGHGGQVEASDIITAPVH